MLLTIVDMNHTFGLLEAPIWKLCRSGYYQNNEVEYKCYKKLISQSSSKILDVTFLSIDKIKFSLLAKNTMWIPYIILGTIWIEYNKVSIKPKSKLDLRIFLLWLGLIPISKLIRLYGSCTWLYYVSRHSWRWMIYKNRD